MLVAGADGFAPLLAGSFLVGVASTAMVSAAELALADLAGDDLERHLMTQNVLGAAGDLLGPAIVVAVLATGGSWRLCFAAGAVLSAAYAARLATLPLPAPHPHELGHSVSAGLVSVLRDPRVWLAGAVGMVLGPLDEPLIGFFIAHLERAEGLSTAGATAVAASAVVGELAGYASLRRWPSRLTLDATALAVATTAMVVAPDPATALLAATAAGVALARFWVAFQARVLLLRPAQAGTVQAVTSVVETVGWSLPPLAGVVADRFDVTAGLATFAVLAWAMALITAAFVHLADVASGSWRSGGTS